MPAPAPNEIETTIEAYRKAFAAADREGWIALFTEDCEQIDPYPSEPNRGHEMLGAFWDRTFMLASNFEFDMRGLAVAGDRAAMTFTLSMEAGGARYEFDGVDVFEFADDGRIAKLTAYWDPTKVRPV
jgi:steroid delta-isomerase